jgi:sulfotransferase family protein
MSKGAGDISIAALGRLAWIFGSSRSGSTWLLRMLSQLERVVPIDDPHLGHHLGVWRPIPLAWATSKDPPKLGTLADFKRQKRDYLFSDHYRDQWIPALRGLIQARYEAQAAEDIRERGIEDPVVVVKEPGSHAADTLIDLFPNSSLIFLLRDGRDVVDSWLDAYSDNSWATDEGAYPLSDEGRTALIRWQSSVWLHRTEVVQETFARHAPHRRLMVRYEQLRRDPVPSLASICRVLGIEASEEQLVTIAGANSYASVPVTEKGSGQEIRRAEPGSWAQTMSGEEIEAMNEILAEKLTELGYLTPGDAPSPRRTLFFRGRAA